MRVRQQTKYNAGYVSNFADSSSVVGQTNMANIMTCLDIAESVAKLVPLVGNVLEGACGVLRKIVQAAEVSNFETKQFETDSAHNRVRALLATYVGLSLNTRRV